MPKVQLRHMMSLVEISARRKPDPPSAMWADLATNFIVAAFMSVICETVDKYMQPNVMIAPCIPILAFLLCLVRSHVLVGKGR